MNSKHLDRNVHRDLRLFISPEPEMKTDLIAAATAVKPCVSDPNVVSLTQLQSIARQQTNVSVGDFKSRLLRYICAS